ncbi:centaurin beta, putative [Ixodes scapularis]|uniref:Centaurin beta, putative n=1 Tax=Ixodes scapularis TaxID=6945 RepID=B7PJP8_IXOSC|nr:centaurin beta, putative [Ixodes scapularis]|eukprot:XP_002408378.1 centaurin beta, putative [Ixodes scapularis]
MRPIVNLDECIRDSPKFREALEENEENIDQLESKLDRNSLNRFIQILTDVLKYQSILLEQAQRSVIKNLNNFIKNDIRQSKETRRHFEKMSDDLDNALFRNSAVPRSKPAECEDAHNVLIATRSCFQHLALDYVHQLSCLQSKKRHEVLQTDVIPVVHKDPSTNNGISLEGYLFKRTSNAFKTWNRRWFIIQNGQLVYRKRSKEEMKTVMEEDLRLCTVKPAQEFERRFCFEVLSPSKTHMLQADSQESYNCWITALQSGISHALNHQPTHDEDDNALPTNVCDAGMARTKLSNKVVIVFTRQTKPNFFLITRAFFGDCFFFFFVADCSQLTSIPGNELCCDCRAPGPSWASINLGITLCIECSGIHRSLGVHVSKVRSLTLDSWEPEILKVMAELGNTVINGVYEARVDESIAVRATVDSSRSLREAWIKAKYVSRAFVKPLLGSMACLTPPRDRAPLATLSELQASHMPRRWSVRKMHRRRRTLQLGERHARAGDAVVEANRRRTTVVSSPVDKPPASADALSVSSLGSETQASLTSQESGGALKDSGVASSVPQSDAEGSGSSQNAMETSSDPSEDDVLVFGESLVPAVPPPSSLELDSADESPTQDEEDTTLEEDISNLSPSLLLYRAAGAHNLPVMCLALANGADPNWTNPDEDGRYPLHQAIQSGSIMACEFLLLNGAKSNSADSMGRTSLHVSTLLGNTGQVCLLLKHGADQHTQDKDGATALKMAVDNANPDIVTMLRLAKLNEEIRRDEFGNPGDDTFIDVVRDFSHMASNNPEILRRQPSRHAE